MAYQLINNEAQKQYEIHTDGATIRIEYILAQDRIFLTHTEVPKGMEGKGMGSAIVRLALEDIEKKGLTLVPLCPFVALFLKRNPEWKKLVMKGINIE